MNHNKVTILDRILIKMFSKSKRVQRIMQLGIGEAYDLGFENGVSDGKKVPLTKHQLKKLRQHKYKLKN